MTDPAEVARGQDSPIALVKVNAIEAYAHDKSLGVATAWRLIGEIIEAPGWTVYHVLRRHDQELARQSEAQAGGR